MCVENCSITSSSRHSRRDGSGRLHRVFTRRQAGCAESAGCAGWVGSEARRMQAHVVVLAAARAFTGQRELWEALARTEWVRERGLGPAALLRKAEVLWVW